MTPKQARQGCMWMLNESSGILEKWYILALKYLVLEICSHFFVISPPTVFCSLWQKRQFWSASLLLLSCINQTVLHFVFPFLPSLLFMSFLNNFSLSHIEFGKIFTYSLCSLLFSLYPMGATLHLAMYSHLNFGTRSLNHKNSEVTY